MEYTSLSPQIFVADLITSWPQIIPLFLQRHMNCVGCSMAAFDTLEDAAAIYGFDPEEFLQELKKVISPLAGEYRQDFRGDVK